MIEIIALLYVWLFLAHIIHEEIKHFRLMNEERRMMAHVEHYLENQYPATMSESEVKEMTAGRWE